MLLLLFSMLLSLSLYLYTFTSHVTDLVRVSVLSRLAGSRGWWLVIIVINIPILIIKTVNTLVASLQFSTVKVNYISDFVAFLLLTYYKNPLSFSCLNMVCCIFICYLSWWQVSGGYGHYCEWPQIGGTSVSLVRTGGQVCSQESNRRWRNRNSADGLLVGCCR